MKNKYNESTWLIVFAISLGIILLFMLSVNIDSNLLSNYNYEAFEEVEIVYLQNSPYGELLVGIKDNNTKLYIDRRLQCHALSNTERVIADITLRNFEKDAEVLSIGLGCGMTLDAILQHDILSVDVVEINEDMPYLTETFFSEYNNNALDDDRLNLIIDDGAHYLMTNDKKYDAIIIDIENPLVAHSSPLYTVDYFKIINNNLNDDGTFALWGYASGQEYFSIMYHSIKEAFPYVYYTYKGNIYIGSKRILDKELLGMGTKEELLIQMAESETEYKVNTLDHMVLKYEYEKIMVK